MAYFEMLMKVNELPCFDADKWPRLIDSEDALLMAYREKYGSGGVL
jgi:hypothetical protein